MAICLQMRLTVGWEFFFFFSVSQLKWKLKKKKKKKKSVVQQRRDGSVFKVCVLGSQAVFRCTQVTEPIDGDSFCVLIDIHVG